MCQVVVLTNMSKITKLDKAINTIAENLAFHQKDGFGYSIQGSEGAFGERTTSDEFQAQFKRTMPLLPFSEYSYNRFGVKTKPVGAGIFHGRTSTNDHTLINTHPINKHGWSLIHNGVVTNHGPKYAMQTTNDTEHMVELLATRGIGAIEQDITGYYAVAALDPNGKLHLFRDSIATLVCAEIPELDTFIFATTATLIEAICKEMKWKHSVLSTVNDNVYLVFDGNTLISQSSIIPRGRSHVETRYAELSLGYSIHSDGLTNEVSSRTDSRSVWDDETTFSESEAKFLEEVYTYADSSYVFLDYHGKEMTYKEFIALEDNEKLYCKVIRSDGTIVDQNNYESETLYQGAV